ncbi:MAG TPA: 2-phospho-L-lactate transferase [Dehalococcoidia bacterium]|nr:2-phospho-L-lactate transferase [Dehalococcoidia bacterium]
MIAVLAGGVGAARFLQGVLCHVPQREITVISNTGDDLEFFGLHVSPDVDIVIYTLAGEIDPARGFGLLHDSANVVAGLARFGHEPWFNLGDRDLATALHRSTRLAQGATLSEVTAEIAAAYGLELRLLPMSDQRVRTEVLTPAGRLAFQDYFVRRRTEDEVLKIEFAGIEVAQPAPGVLEALRTAAVILLAPSNPFVSIGPILALPGVRDALRARREQCVAVSPIVAGETIKGPAAKMLQSLGYENSAAQVAEIYRDVAGAFVLDNADAALTPRVAALGLRPIVTDTIMRGSYEKAALALTALDAVTR